MARDKWIQRAIKRPGALTNWAKRNRKKIKKAIGVDPITKRGDLRDSAIPKIIRAAKSGKLRVRETTMRRLYLAKTLKKLRKHRK